MFYRRNDRCNAQMILQYYADMMLCYADVLDVWSPKKWTEWDEKNAPWFLTRKVFRPWAET